MTYNDFTELVLNEVQNALFPGQTAKLHQVLKSNDTMRTAILIQEDQKPLAPVIYLEEFFDDYQIASSPEEAQKTMRSIVSRILHMANDADEPNLPVSPEKLLDLDFCRDLICCRMLSSKDNDQLLSDTPSVRFHDFSIVFFILLPIQEETNASILVKQNYLDRWGITLTELYAIALANSKRLLPCQFCTISGLFTDKGGHRAPQFQTIDLFSEDSKDSDDEIASSVIAPPECGFYILSNVRQYYGAAAILYPGLLSKIASRLDSSFFILPSSVHEVLIIPAVSDKDRVHYDRMVQEVNTQEVAAEEILGFHCLFYDKNSEKLK